MTHNNLPSRHLKTVAFAVAAALGLAGGSAAWAASQDSHTVNFTITNISEIEVAAGPISLTVGSAAAGATPTPNSVGSTYDITTNASTAGKKITAALSGGDMPPNVTLQVNVAAPTASGTSQGTQTLSSTATDVVTGLQGAAQSGVAITYTLSATVNAAATSSSRSVLYTIVDL